MDVTSTTQVTKTISSDKIVSNPGAELKADDFMKLFITELQYQDPTKPMDNEKMLEQTSQMTQLQTNQDLGKQLKNLIAKMDSTNQFNAINLIGKTVKTDTNQIVVDDSLDKQKYPFDLYFNDAFKEATIKIKDRNGDTVKTLSLENGEKGVKNFNWDGKNDNGVFVGNGAYSIVADYTTNTGENKTTQFGVYPVSSVQFDSGKALVKVGNRYIPLSDVKEVN